jgi:hypothetical protein
MADMICHKVYELLMSILRAFTMSMASMLNALQKLINNS